MSVMTTSDLPTRTTAARFIHQLIESDPIRVGIALSTYSVDPTHAKIERLSNCVRDLVNQMPCDISSQERAHLLKPALGAIVALCLSMLEGYDLDDLEVAMLLEQISDDDYERTISDARPFQLASDLQVHVLHSRWAHRESMDIDLIAGDAGVKKVAIYAALWLLRIGVELDQDSAAPNLETAVPAPTPRPTMIFNCLTGGTTLGSHQGHRVRISLKQFPDQPEGVQLVDCECGQRFRADSSELIGI